MIDHTGRSSRFLTIGFLESQLSSVESVLVDVATLTVPSRVTLPVFYSRIDIEYLVIYGPVYIDRPLT